MHKEELTVAQVGDMIAPLGFLLERSSSKEQPLASPTIIFFPQQIEPPLPAALVKSMVQGF